MRKKALIGFLCANLAVLGLFVRYWDAASTAGNIAMLFCLGVLAANLIYAAFAKNRLGFWLIPAQAGLLLLAYFSRQWASTDIDNLRSVSTINAGAMVAMPLLAGAFFALDIAGVGRKPLRLPKALCFLRWLLPPVLLVGLFTFALFGFDHVYNYGYSYHEYTTTRGDFLFLAMIFAIACLFLRQFIADREGDWKDYLRRNVALLTVFAALAGFGLACFSRGYISLKGDVAAAEADYEAMFGESSKDLADARAVPLSVPGLFFGVPNGEGYEITRDVAYRSVDEGDFAGLRLAYDAYLPTDPDAHRAVVVMLHGSGGDKTEGNKMHLNKYLAAKGYAVYDLQVGDWNEADTNYPEGVARDWDLMLGSLDAFFAYATRHENADFGSAFLIGGSMGGFLATDYIYNYAYRYADYGVDIRGIVPLYGASEAQITGDSLPVLIYTGDHDEIARPSYALRERYREAGNPNAIALTVSFGGHGCDSQFSCRGAQLELYYLVRFLGKLR